MKLKPSKKKRSESIAANRKSDSDLHKYKQCSCPKDDWEVIVVDHDENFANRSTVYHHCVTCDEDFIIEDFDTGEIYFSLDKKFQSRKVEL